MKHESSWCKHGQSFGTTGRQCSLSKILKEIALVVKLPPSAVLWSLGLFKLQVEAAKLLSSGAPFLVIWYKQPTNTQHGQPTNTAHFSQALNRNDPLHMQQSIALPRRTTCIWTASSNAICSVSYPIVRTKFCEQHQNPLLQQNCQIDL